MTWKHLNNSRVLIKLIVITSVATIFLSILLFKFSNAADDASTQLVLQNVYYGNFQASYDGLNTVNYFNGRGTFDYQLIKLYSQTAWANYLDYTGVPITTEELNKVQTIADFESNVSTSSLQQANYNRLLILPEDIHIWSRARDFTFIILILVGIANIIVGWKLLLVDHSKEGNNK